MTVRVYRSTDASAPTLTGQVGSLTSLLDAILVNGYGSQTAAGWTIGFTTTNKRAYLQNTTGSNNPSGMYLYVDDTGPGAGAAREARACGFETMSAITPTGTGQFPTSAQSAIGTGQLVIRKSATADATARAWTAVANGQTLYLFIESGDNVAPTLGATTFSFGDFKSYKASDQYAVMIIGRQTENSSSSLADPLHCLQISNSVQMAVMNTTMFGHFIARSWTGLGGSVRFGVISNTSSVQAGNGLFPAGPYSSETQTAATTTNGLGVAPGRNNSAVGQWPAPNGPDGALAVEPFIMVHNWGRRGYLYGIWMSPHDRPLGHNDVITVTGGNMNGKSLLNQNIQGAIAGSANGDYAQVILETSNTWS